MSTVTMTQIRARNMPTTGGAANFIIKIVAILASISLCFLVPLIFVHHNKSNHYRMIPGAASEPRPVPSQSGDTWKKEIVEGSVNSVSYYHCRANPSASLSSDVTETIQDIVLLHGARFTKKDWETSGILQHLCRKEHVSVTALDLSVKSDYQVLIPLLQAMAKADLVKLPVAALVTPSASGLTVASALSKGQAQAMAQLMQLWVPIASPSVLQLSADQLHKAQQQQQQPPQWSIWSLHGNEDSMGQKVSDKLKAEAGAQVMEFPGGHAFYLSVPVDFSEALLQKLGVTK